MENVISQLLLSQQINRITVDDMIYLQKLFSMTQNIKVLPQLLNNKLDQNNETKDNSTCEETNILANYRRLVFTEMDSIHQPGDAHRQINQQIVDWAIANEVQHYSFLSFPYNSAVCEKQESFIDLKYIFAEKLKGEPRLYISPDLLRKGQADGSSFPSGGLRSTHRARAYTVWDKDSEIFIRKKNKVMYIPSFLVSHYGDALDDMTIFKKSQLILKRNVSELLDTLQIKHKEININLGLQQEFFVIKKQDFLKRSDLKYTGRTLVGNVGQRNQKFSDHYYGKLPHSMEQILKEVEFELLQIGIPFKTKHNEVASNQFQFCCYYEEAGKSILHNLITMEILKQIFDKHGYSVLLHEKPFKEINGSGKHANWSLQYIDQNKKIRNLFSVPKETQDKELFKLFILMNLMAIKKNNALYFAAIAPPGNQIRLGGHQAPPRIISVYLGQTISAIIDQQEYPKLQNLREKLFQLDEDLFQQETDRNRTSPYAYTGHKFEFRALGSSQNAAFPMAVIAATLAKEVKLVSQRLNKGESLKQIIADFRQQTLNVRFEGDGYSKQWAEQAKARGLYENKQFYEIFERAKVDVNVFVEVGACNKEEIEARCETMKQIYIKTVETQARTLLTMARKHIIPQSLTYLKDIQLKKPSKRVSKYIQKFQQGVQAALELIDELETSCQACQRGVEAYKLRILVDRCGQRLSYLIRYLKKDEDFPNLSEILLL